MKRTIKFNDVETASRVAQHLYHVVQDSEKLIFSEFDDAAFKTAVALEGLARVDYSYLDDSLIPSAHTGVRFVVFGRPRVTLDFTLDIPEGRYQTLSLNVLPDIVAMPTDGYDEFPLAIDPRLTYLLVILESAMRHDSLAQQQAFESIVGNLERACMQIRNQRSSHNAFAYANLVIHGSGQSYVISLNLFDASLNMSRSIFE